jgi:hypothetical protein
MKADLKSKIMRAKEDIRYWMRCLRESARLLKKSRKELRALCRRVR